MSTAYEFDLTEVDSPDELAAGGNYDPPAEGTYHLAISAVNMEPVSKKGEAKNGIEISFQVLAGSVEGQEKKSFRETFYWPSPSNKDGGTFLRKRLARLGLVTGVIAPDNLGKSVAVPWPDMEARHLVAAIKHETFTGDNGKESLSAKIDGLKMWHVASPEVVAIPKDAEALEVMPMGDDPFTTGHSNAGGDDAGNGAKPKPPAPKPAPAAARKTKPAATAAPASKAAATATANAYSDL